VSTAPRPADLLGLMRDLIADNPRQNAIIVMGTQDGNVLVLPCEEVPPREAFAYALNARAVGAIDPLSWAAIISDTYLMSMPKDELEDRPESLAEAFKAGDSRISEGLVAMCVSPDGPSYCAQQGYRRDHDEIDFDRVEDIAMHQLGGDFPTYLRALVGVV
jgi:hypothetical protein